MDYSNEDIYGEEGLITEENILMQLSKIEDKVTELVIRKKKQTKEEIIDRDDMSDSGNAKNNELKEKFKEIIKNTSGSDNTKFEETLQTRQETFDKILLQIQI